jgi:hypothetical protein
LAGGMLAAEYLGLSALSAGLTRSTAIHYSLLAVSSRR